MTTSSTAPASSTATADGLHTLGRWTTDRATSTPERVAIDDRAVSYTHLTLPTICSV